MSILRVRTFTSIRAHRNYRLYFLGQSLSEIGTWLQNTAQAWLVLQLTHAPEAVGALAFWQYGPYLVLGLFGGTVSDRFDRRKTLIATQSAFVVCAATLAILAFLRIITVWEVYLFAAVRGVILVLDTPTSSAFLSQMVKPDELPNAVALNASIRYAARIIGPALAGGLLAFAGVGICFAINAASFIAVIAALIGMRVNELYSITYTQSRLSLRRSLGEGMRYAWRTPVILLVLMMLLFIALFSINFSVLLPVLALQTLHAGPAVFGILSACFGMGALMGALFCASLGRANWPILLLSAGGFGLSEVILAPQRTALACATILVVIGICFTVYTTTSTAIVQLAAPDRLQGRVMGLYNYVYLGTGTVGPLLAGWLSQLGGTQLAFFVAGTTGIVMTLIGISGVVCGFTRTSRIRAGDVPIQDDAQAE